MTNQQRYYETTNDTCDGIAHSADDLATTIEGLKDLVERLRDDAGANAATAARCLLAIKETHAKLDAATKSLYRVRDFLDKSIVPTKMEAEGVDMVRIPELGRSFSKQSKMSASFIDKQAGFEWLRSIGQGDIIQETVNAGTLASFVRNMIIEEGIDPPEDVVKVTSYNTTSINKYTPK